jgi:hypothetical protein
MEAPVTNIEHLLLGQMYSLYEQVLDGSDDDEEWSTLPTHTATYLGMGLHYGDRVAVFQSEERDDPKADFGGLILLPEEDLNKFTDVLPFDPDES